MLRWLRYLLALLLLVLPMKTLAANGLDFHTAPGLWLSQAPKRGCRGACAQQLFAQLQQLTHLQLRLHTTGPLAGRLEVDNQTTTTGGSATARAILLRALESGHVFMIEDHSGSPTVNFGQLDEGLRYEEAGCGSSLLIWRVRLDLADFNRVQAPAPVLAAFDPGFVLLHELLHGLGYRDAQEAGQLGDCETYVNQARAELGLPQREQYAGDLLQLAQHFFTVRLPFRDAPKAAMRTGQSAGRRSYLFFAPERENCEQLAQQRTQVRQR